MSDLLIMPNKFCVYIFTNLINNKRYIGKTNNLIRRLRNHKATTNDMYFQRALKKYGFKNFILEIAYNSDDEADAFNMETKLIREYKSKNRILGYNLTDGGEGASGHKVSDEARAKMSAAKMGKYCGPNNPSYGKSPSEETRQKISNSLKGKNHPNFGVPLPEESKRKMSETRKKKYFGETHNAAKLKLAQVLEIKEMLNNKVPRKEIAVKFGVSVSAINGIASGKNWSKAILQAKPKY